MRVQVGTVHILLVAPLQLHSSTSVPSAVPCPVTSRHLPLICSVLPPTVQIWAGLLASQESMTAGVPLAEPLFRAARHLPATPETICPPVPRVTARLSNWSVW